MALVYVTIMVALVGLVLAPMLRFVYTGHRVSQIREQRMLELYSADAGIEDAMYQIKSNIAGISDLDYGDSYDPGTPDGWNDRDMNVQVEKVWIPEDICLDCDDVETPAPTDLTDFSDELVMAGLYSSVELAAATDDFEYPPDPVWGRGAGWADLWEHGGSAIEGIDGDSTSGIGYLSLAGADGYARRQTDLVGFFDPRLQFYAKATSFEPGDSADLSVSTNGADWTTVMTWADGNDTDAYEFVDLDVSAYANATEFWVEFDATLLGGTLASDGFESDDWSGGTGWTGDWLHSGDSSVRSGGGPYEGSYHVRLRRSSGYIARAVDLSASGEATLTFQWKASSFESGDAAYLLVSADGLDWTPVRSWQNGDDDGQYHLEEIDLSSYAAGSSEFWIAFDAGMSSSYDYFYIDDVHIGDNDRFQVDDVWIGNDVDIYTIEVAYTESIGSVFMEGLAVWLPPGAQYIGVTDAWGLPGGAPTRQITSFAGGTVLYWEYASRIDLSQPVGGGGAELPIVRSLTFTFSGAEEDQGMFAWLDAYTSASGGSSPDFISWDTGYELYRATSQASHEIWGTNTQVEVYVGQGEIERRGIATYGDYRATGAPLQIDYSGDSQIKEYRVEPSDSGTWVWNDGFYYDGRSTISDIPAGSEVLAAWLYWSGFVKTSMWSGSADETVDFMYPWEAGAEWLGEVFSSNGDDDLDADYYPIVTLPAVETVWLDDGGGPVTLNQVEHYELDRDNGVLTITDDTLQGNVTMHYWAERWEEITHEASDRYGTPLDPAEEETLVAGYGSQGWAYACFRDVTDMVAQAGNGEYAVDGVTSSLGWDGTIWGHVAYSGWSLIVLYNDPNETAHQFYLYDPIHNADETPFFSGDYRTFEFTLSDFYPPAGVVDGRLTYFVGEGDPHWEPDYVRFKGASQPAYSPLSGPNNPLNNVMNEQSTTGEEGIDIDTFDITTDIGSDTAADLQFDTDIDVWNLIYVILSFKTSMVPKDNFLFNVAALTYSYEIAASQ